MSASPWPCPRLALASPLPHISFQFFTLPLSCVLSHLSIGHAHPTWSVSGISIIQKPTSLFLQRGYNWGIIWNYSSVLSCLSCSIVSPQTRNGLSPHTQTCLDTHHSRAWNGPHAGSIDTRPWLCTWGGTCTGTMLHLYRVSCAPAQGSCPIHQPYVTGQVMDVL